jgi:hypothetical protein
MKRVWSVEELNEQWSVGPHDRELLYRKESSGRLGLVAQLAFYRRHARFPEHRNAFAAGHRQPPPMPPTSAPCARRSSRRRNSPGASASGSRPSQRRSSARDGRPRDEFRPRFKMAKTHTFVVTGPTGRATVTWSSHPSTGAPPAHGERPVSC